MNNIKKAIRAISGFATRTIKSNSGLVILMCSCLFLMIGTSMLFGYVYGVMLMILAILFILSPLLKV